MSRPPLPLGSWGRIWVSSGPSRHDGKPKSFRARALYRDLDGVTREVVAEGQTRSAAQATLLVKLRERSASRHGGSLKATDRFSVAAELWFEQVGEMVADGRRSPGTRDAYRRKLDNHVLPALGEVRLGEVTTPLVDSIIKAIRTQVGPPTAKASRTVISGVLNLAVRHGAIATNPVRDVETIASRPKRHPRALDEDERRAWFARLASDPQAVAADLPDLTSFLLGTGARIGEALGLLWSDVDLSNGEIEIRHQVIRVKGQGLVLVATKSAAGERTLRLPRWCAEMLKLRSALGHHRDEPVFGDALGGLRDPNNVRRDLRRARAPRGSKARQELGAVLAAARRAGKLSRPDVARALQWPRSRIELVEAGRVKVDVETVALLADLYGVKVKARTALMRQAEEATRPEDGDALAWITSHTFRKTTATILDDAGQSARQIADQLGHARPSMTQDVYMGRRAKNPGAAAALDWAFSPATKSKTEGFPEKSRGQADGASA